MKSCHGCRRFQAQAFSSPPQGDLPKDRTEGQTPFQVVGVDYAGPLKYRKNAKTEGKAYVLLYACSLTRALFLVLLPNLETKEFLASFKHFIARRGRPNKVYSDNGRNFVGAAQWIKQVMQDEKNRAQWKLGVVEDLITGRDGVIRGAKLNTGKSHVERPIQHLYPLELSFDKPVQTPRDTLNTDAPVYRPRRDAAAAARFRIQDINENEQYA